MVEWVWSYSWYVDGRGLLALNLVPVSVLEEPVLPHALDTLQPFAVIRMEQLQVASGVAEVYNCYTRGNIILYTHKTVGDKGTYVSRLKYDHCFLCHRSPPYLVYVYFVC